jgi:hypothetical protein
VHTREAALADLGGEHRAKSVLSERESRGCVNPSNSAEYGFRLPVNLIREQTELNPLSAFQGPALHPPIQEPW